MVARELREAGGQAHAIACDVTREDDVVRMFGQADGLGMGPPEVVCYNAGNGKPGYAAISAGKSGLRAAAQSLEREFGPQGLHIAHVVVDGSINGDRIRLNRPERLREKGEDGLLDLDGIAEACWHLHRQPRAAWTHESTSTWRTTPKRRD